MKQRHQVRRRVRQSSGQVSRRGQIPPSEVVRALTLLQQPRRTRDLAELLSRSDDSINYLLSQLDGAGLLHMIREGKEFWYRLEAWPGHDEPGMCLFRARDGKALGVAEAWRRMTDREYCCVADTTLSNGKWVITVWIGLNYRPLPDEQPLLFRTTVFPSIKPPLDQHLEMHWHRTEKEARDGHKYMAAKWSTSTSS